MKIKRLLSIIGTILLGILFANPSISSTQEVDVDLKGTSPFPINNTHSQNNIGIYQNEDAITFSEFSIGTQISDQYADKGILFEGDSPFITTDRSNTTSPVLSGSPLFRGDIEGKFVSPSDDSIPAVVESVSFDAGYFDELGSTRVEWFDADGNKLGQLTNTQFGIETIKITGGDIASWKTSIIKTEPNGYAIDNVSFEPIENSILFREKAEGDGSWLDDEVPGFDHVGLNVNNLVHESHPGYTSGMYLSEDGEESKSIVSDFGVQAQHTKATFAHYSKVSGQGNSAVTEFAEIPIEEDLAQDMKSYIDTQLGAKFQQFDPTSIKGIKLTLSAKSQKNLDNSGTFTCVGLIERAAEEAGHNLGQGFIPNSFESVGDFPLLSPELLYHSMKFSYKVDDFKNWLQGFIDPVDFIVVDPLGRRLGYTQALGEINEIPNAFYSGDGQIEQFLIPNPVPGNYQILLTGLGEQVNAGIGSDTSFKEVAMLLEEGEMETVNVPVFMYAGSPGDVNEDGCIDEQDVSEASLLLNTFTNGLNHPADMDKDGVITQSDIALIEQQASLGLCVREAFLPLIFK